MIKIKTRFDTDLAREADARFNELYSVIELYRGKKNEIRSLQSIIKMRAMSDGSNTTRSRKCLHIAQKCILIEFNIDYANRPVIN